MPVVPSPVETYIEDGLEAALAGGADDETAALVQAVDRLLTARRPAAPAGVRANADTAEDADRARNARRAGHRAVPHRAHVPRRPAVADRTGHPGRHRAASGTPRWTRCCRCSARTSSSCWTAMDGLPVTIRLLDPPLHEFLPDRTELSVKVALAEAPATPVRTSTPTERCWPRWSGCTSPTRCSGLRGVRLGLLTPGLFALQVRAITEAAIEQIKAGKHPQVEIMVPLVGSVMELHLVRDEAEAI